MKVLWLITLEPPIISMKYQRPIAFVAGWISGMLNSILTEESLELIICYPSTFVNSITFGTMDNIKYCSIPIHKRGMEIYDKNLIEVFDKIISGINPDIIHIFGTEYPQTYAMTSTNYCNKTVISISGIVSVIAEHYYGQIPEKYCRKQMLMRILSVFIPWKVRVLSMGKDDFIKRGEYEKLALRKAKYVIGRTDWDEACMKRINPNIKYYFCNESLRDSFYKEIWKIEQCNVRTIFVSQAGYPIKGFHNLLKALPIILEEYPDTQVYVGGPQLIKKRKGIRNIVFNLLNPYARYLKKIIREYKLENNVTFLGYISEEKMCEQYLKANVFVLPSYIENSPNSLGEAMILGVPCIATAVGGVQSMMKHKEDGYIYPYNEYYMLAYYIKKIFKDNYLAETFSSNARKHALETHNREKNKTKLFDIYRSIAGLDK